jgi:hypothetical protein
MAAVHDWRRQAATVNLPETTARTTPSTSAEGRSRSIFDAAIRGDADLPPPAERHPPAVADEHEVSQRDERLGS